jgi:hypothetical protein
MVGVLEVVVVNRQDSSRVGQRARERLARIEPKARHPREAAGFPDRLLIEVATQVGRLGLPAFSRALSKNLNTTVIAFFLQTTVSNEHVEHLGKRGGEQPRTPGPPA